MMRANGLCNGTHLCNMSNSPQVYAVYKNKKGLHAPVRKLIMFNNLLADSNIVQVIIISIGYQQLCNTSARTNNM